MAETKLTKREVEDEELKDITREATLSEVVSEIDDLIWRRKLLGKPHDQLESIRDKVTSL